MLQVVARRILAERSKSIPHPAVGQDDLEAEHLIAHVPVTEDVVAASVSGRCAADRCGSPGTPIRGEESIGAGRCFLQCLHRDPGLHGGGPTLDVDRLDCRHPYERDDDTPLTVDGNRPTRDSGIAALADDRHLMCSTCTHDRSHLLSRSWADHGHCVAAEPLTPVDKERRSVVIGQYRPVTDNASQLGDE